MRSAIQFNGAKADYTSPAYLARQAQRAAEYRALQDCARFRPERMRMKTRPPAPRP